MFNLINLVFCETLKILGLVFTWIWGFCSNWVQLTKVACWIDVIDHYFLYSILCDDQLVNFLQIEQVVFQIFGVFVRNSMLKPILWTWTSIELNFTTLEHASWHLTIHASYRFLFYIFFVLTCSLPLVFVLFFCFVSLSLS